MIIKQIDNEVSRFWSLARSFLKVHLVSVRNLSKNTILAYKQSIESLIKFLEDSGYTRDSITLEIITPEVITNFIIWMTKVLNCKPRTCNLRLSAIKSFLRYCSLQDITNESISRQIIQLPMKKIIKDKIEYMSKEAVAAILNAPDTNRSMGRRNATILTLLYDSAARVQELVDLKLSDLHIDGYNFIPDQPFITLHGKGNKTRNVIISTKTANLLNSYIKQFHSNNEFNAPLFYTKRAGSLYHLSVDSVSRILTNSADKARSTGLNIPEKVYCHLLRKSRAMHLYISGVPLVVIMELLGHTSINTTSGFYAFVTWEMVSEAMKKANEGHLDETKTWDPKEAAKIIYSLD